MRRQTLVIAILLAFVAGFVIGVQVVRSDPLAVTPSLDDAAFRAFPTYRPSPTPIAGLHEYGSPLAPAPTTSPKPDKTARPKAAPTAGHTASGSGTRTIVVRSSKGELGGYATWFATGRDGFYAAAGPALRKAIGPNWRGSQVLVSRYGTRKGIVVTLNDWCACGPRNGRSTLLDLSDEAFSALAPLSRGVISVAVDIP